MVVWQFLKMLNTNLPCDSVISRLDINLREVRVYPHKDSHGNVLSGISHNSPIENNLNSKNKRMMDKICCLHSVKYYSTIKKEQTMRACYNVDKPEKMLNEAR